MVAAPGAAPPRLASAALRWPRRGPAASPPPRARRRRERRPEIGWSRDGWRCAAASKPALAGLGEIKNKTNKLAKRLGSWGGAGAAGRRGLGFWSPRGAGGRAAVPTPRPPSLAVLARETDGLDQRISEGAGSSMCASVATLFSPHCGQLGGGG